MQITVKSLNGEIILDVKASDTIADVKTKVPAYGVEGDMLCLIFDGVELMNELTLAESDINNEDIINCVIDLVGGAPDGCPVRGRKVAIENLLRTLQQGKGSCPISQQLRDQIISDKPTTMTEIPVWYETAANLTRDFMGTSECNATIKTGLTKILTRYDTAQANYADKAMK